MADAGRPNHLKTSGCRLDVYTFPDGGGGFPGHGAESRAVNALSGGAAAELDHGGLDTDPGPKNGYLFRG